MSLLFALETMNISRIRWKDSQDLNSKQNFSYLKTACFLEGVYKKYVVEKNDDIRCIRRNFLCISTKHFNIF